MNIKKVFINTYRYDFHFARVCIASIRYWYPDIPIYLIKDENSGTFDTRYDEKLWNVDVLNVPRKKFGWGYGKLETLFLNQRESYFVIDADAVITGPVFDVVNNNSADFIVDDEVQPTTRFNEIYFRLDRIKELDKNYVYPGYSFNTGQWFGTSAILSRDDFNNTLNWSEPPSSKNASIVFNNDQTHLNYVVHTQERLGRIAVARIRLLVWPKDGAAKFIDLEKIRSHSGEYPYVIHWAGMSAMKFNDLPRQDILQFYQKYYYSRGRALKRFTNTLRTIYLDAEKKFTHTLKR
ncbi:MAG: hypothetical protein EOO04_36505 [Chitinophagaceae bacterium]|nr:MAG: hypothetical protein EOO04_36505 [Chitinophagaceae bacterium]